VDLEGRVAVVTGGSAGIGRAIASALAGAGAGVVLTSRDRSRAEAAAAEVGQDRPGAVVGLPLDVRDPASCRALVSATLDRFGRLDILVNNAGVGIFKPFQEMSEEDWRVQVETNLHGVFHCTKAALPSLLEAGRGRDGDAWVINVGSLASRNSFAGGAGYNASKFGLLGMTEAMMIDLRYEGIRTAILMPGSVDTAFQEAGERPWALQADDVGRAVLHLLSYPTGALVSRVEMRPTRPPRR
jgi:NAD(P)-dependent dehydrogenase (short-subunit alcohol dehydrogenase family)